MLNAFPISRAAPNAQAHPEQFLGDIRLSGEELRLSVKITKLRAKLKMKFARTANSEASRDVC